MTERIIKVCPDCDAPRVRPVSGKWYGEKGYYCDDCQKRVEPVKREATTPGSNSETVNKLLDMRPDELSG